MWHMFYLTKCIEKHSENIKANVQEVYKSNVFMVNIFCNLNFDFDFYIVLIAIAVYETNASFYDGISFMAIFTVCVYHATTYNVHFS